ncbi:MAG: flagellar biosynthesis anti-sigma factor FlgM [Firmicutes bacterium]|nr:flagellar biosynthesis anti-sigma factor FlgM [Bacillota bacterium]
MKINRPEIINLIHKVYKREQLHNKTGQVEKKDALSGDRFEISAGSEMLKKEFSRLAESGASHAAKVEELARRVEDGAYKVNSRKLAEAMLKYMETEAHKNE